MSGDVQRRSQLEAGHKRCGSAGEIPGDFRVFNLEAGESLIGLMQRTRVVEAPGVTRLACRVIK
jgi:hypothetical protein